MNDNYNIDIDTEKIAECANDINLMVSEIKELFDDMFQYMIVMTTNGAWQGISAQAFGRDTNLDKINYVRFRQSLNEYSKYLNDYSVDMKRTIWSLKK